MRQGVFFCCIELRKPSQHQPVSLKGLFLLSSSHGAADASFFSPHDNKQTSASHLCCVQYLFNIRRTCRVQYDGTFKNIQFHLLEIGNQIRGQIKQMCIGLNCKKVFFLW